MEIGLDCKDDKPDSTESSFGCTKRSWLMTSGWGSNEVVRLGMWMRVEDFLGVVIMYMESSPISSCVGVDKRDSGYVEAGSP